MCALFQCVRFYDWCVLVRYFCVCCSTRFLCFLCVIMCPDACEGCYWCCGGDCTFLSLCLAPDIVGSPLPFAPCFLRLVSAWMWFHLTLLRFFALPLCLDCGLSVFLFLRVCLSLLFPSLSMPPPPPSPRPSLLSAGILAYHALSNQTMDTLAAVGGEGKPRTAYGRLAAGEGSRCPSVRGWGTGDESV